MGSYYPLLAWTNENVDNLGAFLVGLGPWGGPLASQMVDLGCQDHDWVGGYDKDILDAILLRDGLILPKVLIKAYYKPILRGFYQI